MDRTLVRRWMAGFEAAAEADRAEWRRRGPEPAWSIRIALSMIEAARGGRGWPGAGPETVGDDAVRETWARLRARLGR